jgi:hypothetical protein
VLKAGGLELAAEQVSNLDLGDIVDNVLAGVSIVSRSRKALKYLIVHQIRILVEYGGKVCSRAGDGGHRDTFQLLIENARVLPSFRSHSSNSLSSQSTSRYTVLRSIIVCVVKLKHWIAKLGFAEK